MAGTKTYIRIAGKRDVTTDLVSVGGNDYEMEFPELVFNAEQVTTTAENTTTTRSFSQSGTTLTVTTTSAPSATLPIIISFYIFITDKIVSYEKTDIATGDVVEWQPWLSSSPKITQSIGDILEGKLIVSASGVSFINNKSLNYLMDESTSFFNQPLKIWADYGNGSIEDVFTGRTTNFVVGASQYQVKFKNDFVALTGFPTMGDNSEETNITNSGYKGTLGYGNPIPYIWGQSTPYEFAQKGNVIAHTGTIYKKENCLKVSDITLGGSPNFFIGRIPSTHTFRPLISFTLISGGTVGLSSAVIQLPNDTEMQKLIVGQYQGDVYDGVQRNCHVAISDLANRQVTLTLSGLIGSVFTGTVTTFKANSACMLFSDSSDFDSSFGYWYYNTLIEADTDGGHKRCNAFPPTTVPQANNSGVVTIDTKKHDVYVYFPNTLTTKHGDVIKAIAEGQGLTVNSASITAANSALPQNVYMTIPDLSKIDYDKSALEVMGDVLVSTFGYVYINKSGELVYKLVDTDTASHTVTDTDIIDGTLNVKMDFRDIQTKIKITPQNKYALAEGVNEDNEFNAKEAFMSDTANQYEYKSVLYDNSTVPQKKLNYLSRPRLKISMTIPNTFSDMEIGDFVDLSSVQLEDMDLSNLMITTITRTSIFLEITLTKIEIT